MSVLPRTSPFLFTNRQTRWQPAVINPRYPKHKAPLPPPAPACVLKIHRRPRGVRRMPPPRDPTPRALLAPLLSLSHSSAPSLGGNGGLGLDLEQKRKEATKRPLCPPHARCSAACFRACPHTHPYRRVMEDV